MGLPEADSQGRRLLKAGWEAPFETNITMLVMMNMLPLQIHLLSTYYVSGII